MVNGRHQENPAPFAVSLLRKFEPEYLYHDRYILNQEDPAENRDQQFFPDCDGKYCNDSTERETSGIAHENLCGIGVIPEKSDAGSDKCADENRELSRLGDIHDIEVIGKNVITRQECQYRQNHPNNCRCSGSQTVQSI